MSLKVSMPGKFSHLPLNKLEPQPIEVHKAGSVAAIQQLLNKVQQKTAPDGVGYKRDANIESMKTHREHSPPQEGLVINQILSGPIVTQRGADRNDQYGTVKLQQYSQPALIQNASNSMSRSSHGNGGTSNGNSNSSLSMSNLNEVQISVQRPLVREFKT